MSGSLRVQLKPSRVLAAAVALGHILALAGAATGLPPVAASVVALGLGLSAFHHLRLAMHRSALAVAGLEFSPAGHFALSNPAGVWLSAEMRRAAVPAGWLAVLAARDANGRSRFAVILPDSVEPEAFRRLRVWLRWRVAATRPEPGRSK
ncbi:MAG TPA: protein YgfX [Burkholderiales bacterium]|nr:protein YgfX [Burkholderiales bacterium]